MKSKVGSIRRRGERWEASVTAGFRADGKKRRVSKSFATRQDAEAWVLSTSVDMDRRPDLDAGVTLSALWSLYEGDKGKRLAAKTLQGYRSQMRTWLEAMGETDISRISCADVQRAISKMTHENALHSKRTLSSVLTYAVSMGLLASNPLHGHKFEIPAPVTEDAFYDDDPFAAIDGSRNVWDVATVVRCYDLIQGLPLETAWLACVGAGLRVEEALALRRMDVRRVSVAGVEVTQLAVHHARTAVGGTKATKTRQSVRVVAMLEPFGERYWELAQSVDAKDLVCAVSACNQNKRWRNYWEAQSDSKHASAPSPWRERLAELPYLPLSKMRNTHATLMQQAGVLDSINAAMHGHSETVSRRHYLRPDTTGATVAASASLRLVV